MRYLGALGAGPLPLDRPHQVKVYGNYQLPLGLNLGVGFTVSSGKPLTALAAHPVYGNAGEIPEARAARASTRSTVSGPEPRPDFNTAVHADYGSSSRRPRRSS